jgi:hypothetical protein
MRVSLVAAEDVAQVGSLMLAFFTLSKARTPQVQELEDCVLWILDSALSTGVVADLLCALLTIYAMLMYNSLQCSTLNGFSATPGLTSHPAHRRSDASFSIPFFS